MDKFTKNYIDDIVKPMINRIQSLQRSNAQLQVHVKYLQSLITSSGTYQKPTISAANHMRDSRISSKGEGSAEKRPGWNSKTKFEQSPAATTKEQPIPHEKLKTKPPIPKMMKSPNKNDPYEDMRSSGCEKKIIGGVKCQADNSQKKIEGQTAQASPIKSESNRISAKQSSQQKPHEFNLANTKAPIINNTFQQLVKNNTEILTSMKQNSQNHKQPSKTLSPPLNNYVQKANSPKSEYNQSQTTSPNERSFASQANPQEKVAAKPLDGMKINLDCNMAKIELK